MRERGLISSKEPIKVQLTVASIFIGHIMDSSVKRVRFVYKHSRSRDCGSINSSDIHFHHENSLIAGR